MNELKPQQVFDLLDIFEVDTYEGDSTFKGGITFSPEMVVNAEIRYKVVMEDHYDSIEFALQFFIKIDDNSFVTTRLYEGADQVRLVRKFKDLSNQKIHADMNSSELAYNIINRYL